MADDDGKKKIDIQVGRDPEIEALRKELEDERKKTKDAEEKLTEFEAEKTQRALEAFDEEKEKLLELAKDLPQEKLDELGEKITPENIEGIKHTMRMMLGGDLEGKKTPTGKATLQGKGDQKSTLQEKQEMIQKLYYDAYKNKNIGIEEQKEAEAKINKLWKSFLKNPTRLKLRGLGRVGPSNVINTSCLNCGYPLAVGSEQKTAKCPKCGHVTDLDLIEKGGMRA